MSKFANDNEFKCLRRMASNLGLSMPVSDGDILNLTQLRRIERAISSAFGDELSSRLAEENKRLREALLSMTELYCDLINSGDAGNWNPEDDQPVISARLALSELDGEK